MSIVIYPALVSGSGPACEVSFPDLPLPPFAASEAELLAAARSHLLRELERLEREGEGWPTPTPLGDLQRQAAGREAALVLVDVAVDDTPVRVNISIGERLLRRIDTAAGAADMSRSGYIAAACRQRLGAERDEGGEGARKLQDDVAQLGRRVDEVIGPDSPLGKALSELDHKAGDQLKRFISQLGASGGRKWGAASSDNGARERASPRTHGSTDGSTDGSARPG